MSTPISTRLSAAAVQQAVDALRHYTTGSPRGALVPLDDAVAAATAEPAAARDLEQRLLTALDASPPDEAKEYICRKLTLIGSAACVPALARLLRDPATTHAARDVLQSLPIPEAGDALRGSLDALSGAARIGAILSLGLRRESASLATLVPLLERADDETVRAAAAALGEIGTSAAAESLAGFLPKASAGVRAAVADACLVCAERQAQAGQTHTALALYDMVQRAELASHRRKAAELGRQRLEGASRR